MNRTCANNLKVVFGFLVIIAYFVPTLEGRKSLCLLNSFNSSDQDVTYDCYLLNILKFNTLSNYGQTNY
jgi:hypothetical protein